MRVDDENLDELGKLWRTQPTESRNGTPQEALAHVRAKARRHDRAIFWRNVREAGAGALLIGVMGGTSWLAPGWLPKAAGLVGMASVVLVIARLVASRRRNPPVPPDLALVDWLRGEARKVDAEMRLLRSVRSWYLAPLFVGSAIWCGVLVAQGLGSLPLTSARFALALTAVAAIMATIFGLVGWVVWRLNEIGARTFLEPYAAELRTLLDDVASDNVNDKR